jgi:hypothetical protein
MRRCSKRRRVLGHLSLRAGSAKTERAVLRYLGYYFQCTGGYILVILGLEYIVSSIKPSDFPGHNSAAQTGTCELRKIGDNPCDWALGAIRGRGNKICIFFKDVHSKKLGCGKHSTPSLQHVVLTTVCKFEFRCQLLDPSSVSFAVSLVHIVWHSLVER